MPYGPDPAERLDVYHLERGKGAPIIVMVHGGGWRRGDKSSSGVIADKVDHWVPKGIIFISVNYRMLPEAGPLEQARDIARALAFVQTKARGWGGDPARVVMIGHSAGAHLVALLAADPAFAAEFGAKRWLGTVALDSAAMDVVAIMETWHLPLYNRAFGTDPAYWRRASPLHRLSGKTGPMLMVCSTRREVSCRQAHSFAAKVGAGGGRASVLPVALSHREINVTLGRPGRYTAEVDAFLRTLGLP